MCDMPSLFDQTNQEQSSYQVIILRNFLGSCAKLLNDKNSLQVVQTLLEKCNSREEGVKRVNHVCKKRRTRREFVECTIDPQSNIEETTLCSITTLEVGKHHTMDHIMEGILSYSLASLRGHPPIELQVTIQ
jgi:hypothetical protein